MAAIDFRANQTRTNKIISSGSTGTNAQLLVYPFSAASDSQGGINSSKFNTALIGTDVFMFVSGQLSGKGKSGVSVFGGDTVVSGTFYASSSYSNNFFSLGGFFGSHQFLADGTTNAFLAGPGITLSTNGLGQLVISGSGGTSDPGIFTVSGSYARTTSSLYIGKSNVATPNIGNDVYFAVSGSLGDNLNKSVFTGDVLVSGTLYVKYSPFGGVADTLYLDAGTVGQKIGNSVPLQILGAPGAISGSGNGVFITAGSSGYNNSFFAGGGGGIVLSAGSGSIVSSSANSGGNGGEIDIFGGSGGNSIAASVTAGVGALVLINGGGGGNNAFGTGGAAGDVGLLGGTGGSGISGGKGGNIVLLGGSGGSNNGGAGNVSIDTGTPDGSGQAGTIKFDSSQTARSLTIGNSALLPANTYFFINGNNTTKQTYVSGTFTVSGGVIRGMHHRLADGTPAYVAGPNITIMTQSNGAIAISASANGVTASIGQGAVLPNPSGYKGTYFELDNGELWFAPTNSIWTFVGASPTILPINTFTSNSGGGGANPTTGFITLPTGVATSNFSDTPALLKAHGYNGLNLDTWMRFGGFSGGNTQSQAVVGLGNSGSLNGVFVRVYKDGGFDFINVAGTALYTHYVSASLALDGNGWIRMRFDSGAVSLYTLYTTASAPSDTDWKLWWTGNHAPPTTSVSGSDLSYFICRLDAQGGTSGDLTGSFGDVTFTSLK